MFKFSRNILGLSIRFSISSGRRKKSSDIFVAYIEDRIAAMEHNDCLYKGNRYAGNSIANYKKILKLWPDFEKFIGRDNIRISDITMDTYSRFMEFCNSRHYMESTKYQYLTLIKAVMNSALEDGVSDNRIQNSKRFVTHRVSSVFKKVYLTEEEEISRLADLNLDTAPSSLRKVRDVFLIGCWTGQRFSDYSGISMDEIETIVIDGEEYKALRMIQKKTDRTVLVPVLDMRLSEIIDSPTTVCCRKGGMKIKTVRPPAWSKLHQCQYDTSVHSGWLSRVCRCILVLEQQRHREHRGHEGCVIYSDLRFPCRQRCHLYYHEEGCGRREACSVSQGSVRCFADDQPQNESDERRSVI